MFLSVMGFIVAPIFSFHWLDFVLHLFKSPSTSYIYSSFFNRHCCLSTIP